MNTRRKHRNRQGYTTPAIRLIELESEAPILANSVDQFEGDTGPGTGDPAPAPQGIGLEDFVDGGNITLP